MRWLLVLVVGCGMSAQERANLEMQCHAMPCPELKISILLPKDPPGHIGQHVLVCQCVDDYTAIAERELAKEQAERDRQWNLRKANLR